MLSQAIVVKPFEKEYQSDIDVVMENIALEFKEPIFSSGSKKISDIYQLPGNQFWVALSQNKAIGTIGLVQLADGHLVLKSMFVDSRFRGQGASQLLLDNAIDWAMANNCRYIFLGTMSQFTAAQRFYEKNGFVQCAAADLPVDFVSNVVDTIFYKRHLEFESFE